MDKRYCAICDKFVEPNYLLGPECPHCRNDLSDLEQDIEQERRGLSDFERWSGADDCISTD